MTPRLDIAWLGHATTDIRMGDTRILTDPLLRDRVAHLVRHDGTGTVEPGRVDAVLVSHLHHDHLDLPSLRTLDADTVVVVPRGAASVVARAAPGEVVELAAGESVHFGSVRVDAVPAVHQSGRALRRARAEPLGFVLEDGAHTVYFPGDTDLYDAMSDLPAPDVALLPIWGWGPNLGPGHLDPASAADAAALLRARAVLPVHWGTFAPRSLRRGAPEWLARPAPAFLDAMARAAPDTHVRLVRPSATPMSFW
jgi:L-ascorbate metabolism protein UlaG (beta-lactamase superfamily)